VFVFLLVFFLILLLVRLWRIYWLQLQSSRCKAETGRTTVHHLLKPRTLLDCPFCRLACPPSPSARPASAAVRPWGEVKSRRGAPKRVNTQGFACLNQQCLYFGITDSHMHALVGDGKHGRVEHIQMFRCQDCHATFTAKRNTPLYLLKTPSHQIAMVLSALAEGFDPSAAERVFGFRQATIALQRSSGCGWRLILARRFFRCLNSVPAPNTWHIASSIPCEIA